MFELARLILLRLRWRYVAGSQHPRSCEREIDDHLLPETIITNEKARLAIALADTRRVVADADETGERKAQRTGEGSITGLADWRGGISHFFLFVYVDFLMECERDDLTLGSVSYSPRTTTFAAYIPWYSSRGSALVNGVY